MLSADLECLLTRTAFRDAAAARARLVELALDNTELLALVHVADDLVDALAAAADPDAALRHLSRFAAARGSREQLYHFFGDDPAAMDRLIRVLGASQYLADVLVRNPEFLDVVSNGLRLSEPRSNPELAEELARTCAPFSSAAGQLDAVRRFRRREMLRIGAGDLCDLLNLRQVTEQLSHLADAVISQCLAIVAEADSDSLVVLALGKLGGGELNYSSDIDLIYVATDLDRLDAAARQARALTHALSDATGEGFLYRVDLRLRPFGGGGALVVSAEMLEDYLGTSAEPAERQAMLKARSVAGNIAAGESFLSRLAKVITQDGRSARLQVRQLKERIERQLRQRGESADHLKLGKGGIRDIEFIVQALQIESAASDAHRLTGNTLAALDRLAAAGLLSRDDSHALREAYIVLRLIEHHLQLMDNQQVHRLPQSPAEWHILAKTLEMRSFDAERELRETYHEHSTRVRAIFERELAPDVGQTFLSANPASLRAQDEEILDRISAPADVELVAQRESHVQWKITVVLWDHLGVLSIIAGLFAAYRVDILEGDALSLLTLNKSRRKALDTFIAKAPHWLDDRFWRQIQSELAELAGMLAAGEAEAAREKIVARVSPSAALAGSVTPLFPVQVDVDNASAADATCLAIRSTNTVGFLFEFAAALAALNINIRRVEIRTTHHEVDDTFWVTDARGRKVDDPDRIHELQVAAALIKQFLHLLPQSPDPPQALRQFSALTRQMLGRSEWVSDLQSLKSDAVLRTLADMLGVSQFLWEDFLREQHENLFPVLRNIPALDESKTKAQLRAELLNMASGGRESPGTAPFVASTDREADASRSPIEFLNQFKDREMFRIDLRHITGRIDLLQFSHELTDLAEVVVEEGCRLCHEALEQQFGAPRLENGQLCRWCVCGLGKFGGRELGFASDIELLLVYEGAGHPQARSASEGYPPGDSHSISNARYFDELVTQFLQTLVTRREGIFEIDLRLRPHGKAGSLACSLDGFRGYFSAAGGAQQFERLALVKLRPVAGDRTLGEKVVMARNDFVYSAQPLDYQNILHLRQRHAKALVAPRPASAKHSQGGLVDIEYFVQAKQIEIGRDDASVRVTGTLEAIDRLAAAGALTAEQAVQLSQSYRFLRQLIEALRVVRGHSKDLTIPAPSQREFDHLARRMRCDSPAALAREIDDRMAFAHALWAGYSSTASVASTFPSLPYSSS